MTADGTTVELGARRTALRQVLAPGWAVLACVLVAAQAPAGVRAPVVIVFLCVVPGTALVGLVNPDSFAVELSLAIALSVALSGLTAGVLAYAHLWSPTAVVVIVAAISLAGGLRDVGLGHRVRHAAPKLLHLLRAPLAGARRAGEAGRAAALLSGGIAAVPGLAPRAEPRGRSGAGLVAFRELLRPAGRLRGIAAVRPPRATADRPRREPRVAQPVPASPLQRFLLDELRRRTGSDDSRRRQPRSLAHLQPDELADLLSWSSLQRFVTQRAIREINPELWFVDDLERRLPRQTRASRRELSGRTLPAPRGVWITGVSARASIPVAWRVLEDDGKAKEWRTRLALEMIDLLPELSLGGAVVTAGTAYGSLAGFRRGLEGRGLHYLLRIDPVTAARELAPDRPSRSAAEARQVLRERIADGDAAPAGEQGAHEEPELVLVPGEEHVLLCEVRAAGRTGVFWLSNLPAETAPGRFASLMRLADRSRVKRANLLTGALEAEAEGGAGLDRELALVALAGGLRTLDLSTTPAKTGVEP